MEDLRLVLENGFSIHASEGKFLLKKEAVPINSLVLPPEHFDSFEKAVEIAVGILRSSEKKAWTPIVRYNRGLGIEYRNLPQVHAENRDEAKILAREFAENILKSADNNIEIIEIMVYLKINT